MRVGISLPQFGSGIDLARVAEFARTAEGLGYDSLWVGDRLLAPVDPSLVYPGGGTPEQPIPPEFFAPADPQVTLTAAAAATTTARLGSSTLNAPWYGATVLARSLTTLDAVSAGRLDAGIGIGWLPEEYEAAGVAWARRGARLEELLDVLDAYWGAGSAGGVVEHSGERYTVPRSHVELRPAQAGGPPVLLGGWGEATMERIGRRAAGWVGGVGPAEWIQGLWDVARRSAERAGRDPDALRRELRINLDRTQGVDDALRALDDAEALGADGAFVDPIYLSPSVDAALEVAEKLIKARRG